LHGIDPENHFSRNRQESALILAGSTHYPVWEIPKNTRFRRIDGRVKKENSPPSHKGHEAAEPAGRAIWVRMGLLIWAAFGGLGIAWDSQPMLSSRSRSFAS
jgi:hypothetical protein